MHSFLASVLMLLLLLTAIVLIVLVLIQRGKGGGLAGAFGGMGGQSAFGTKAGDTFTRITIGVATFWIVLCVITVAVLGVSRDRNQLDMGGENGAKPAANAPVTPGKQSTKAEQAPAKSATPAKSEAPVKGNAKP